MNKYILLATAALALTACEAEDNQIDDPVAAQISANIGDDRSRASDIKWDNGDVIGVTMSGRYFNMAYSTENGDGAFEGTVMYFRNKQDLVTISAYYPFTGTEGETPGVIVTSTESERQTASEQTKFDFLYAVKENVSGANPNVDLLFRHQMSKLTLTFVNGNKGTEVGLITSYSIEGLVQDGSFDTETGICSITSGAPAKTLSFTFPEGTVKEGVALSPLILFPQNPGADQVRLRLSDSQGQDYACTLSFGPDGLVAGSNYQFTIKVSKTGLTVNPTIAPWEDGIIADEDPEASSED